MENIDENQNIIFNIKDVNLYYGDNHTLKNINLEIKKYKKMLLQSTIFASTYISSFQDFMLRR